MALDKFNTFLSGINKRNRPAPDLLQAEKDESIIRAPSFPGQSGFIETVSTLYSELDNLVGEGDSDESAGSFIKSTAFSISKSYPRIKRSHWKDSRNYQNCSLCLKAFGFTSKKQNCRRCGNVFCDSCCHYRRRLSPDAIPDPQGNIYRVCYTCADLQKQPLGEVTHLTDLYMKYRMNRRISIAAELNRLLDGFRGSIRPNERLKSSVTDTVSMLKIPLWQRSDKWLESSEVEWCCYCSVKFTMLSTKHHCRVCGSVYCTQCCSQDLLLYYGPEGEAKAALINVVGCPDKEPPVCLYVTICILCSEEMEEIQVQQYHLRKVDEGATHGSLRDVSLVLEKLKTIETKLESILPRYQEMVENLTEGGAKLNELAESGQNTVQLFAKLQVDLSDLLTQYAVVIQGLKQFSLCTKTELKIMRNVITLKCQAYNQSMGLFKGLKENLSKTLPAKALLDVQNYADKQSINGTCIVIRQLGFETLNLATKFNFQPIFAEKVSECDQVCFKDLKECISEAQENWEEHEAAMNELLKIQLKEKLLIRPTQSRVDAEGAAYVECVLLQRSQEVLYQVLKALKAKSSDTKFLKSKECIHRLLTVAAEFAVLHGQWQNKKII